MIDYSTTANPSMYRSLAEKLQQLARQVHLQLPQIQMLVLFGSVARFEASEQSDADVLAICDETVPYHYPENRGIFGAITDVEELFSTAQPSWSISLITGNNQIDDLDPDFLACVAHDGILAYRRSGYDPPQPLNQLVTWHDWIARIHEREQSAQPIR